MLARKTSFANVKLNDPCNHQSHQPPYYHPKPVAMPTKQPSTAVIADDEWMTEDKEERQDDDEESAPPLVDGTEPSGDESRTHEEETTGQAEQPAPSTYVPVRRSSRITKPPAWLSDYVHKAGDKAASDPAHEANLVTTYTMPE